jgi:hypothetical protein
VKTSLAILLIAITITFASGAPDERAQVFKRLVVEQMMQDGWRLTQEGQMLVTFERPSGVAQTFVMRLMTGANGTWATERLSLTFVPRTDHYTYVYWNPSIDGQNAFGARTSVPLKSKKVDQYINAIVDAAAARLPKKYASQSRKP